MSSSKKDHRNREIDRDLEASLPRLPEKLRAKILAYIEDYLKSKKEKIH